ncbi:MAG: hypothetical protein J07HN6_01938 [Halonotius sp. J07HN6]|nr:MAG: hypothetical protein J07HN6_01938 [Halonotius sp. J07HN6]
MNATAAGGMPTGEFPPSQGLDAIGNPETGVIIAGAALLVVLGLLLSFLSDVLRFSFYEMLRTDEVRLVESATRRVGQAVRFFGFNVVVQLLTLLPFAVIVYGAIAGWLPTEPAVLVAVGLLSAVVLLLSTVVSRLTQEFVVPTMVVTDSGVLDGWRRFWPILRGNLAEFGVYLVVHFLLLLAIGIAQSILSLLVFGLIGVVGAMIGLVVVFGLFGGLSAAIHATAGMVLLVVIGGLTLFIAWVLLLPVQIVVLTSVTTYELSMLGAVDEELRLRPDTTDDSSTTAVVD